MEADWVVFCVLANLHITTLGHGYHTNQHVDHKRMCLNNYVLC
jgi:hypothetical protein